MRLDEVTERANVRIHIPYLRVEVGSEEQVLLTLLLLKTRGLAF